MWEERKLIETFGHWKIFRHNNSVYVIDQVHLISCHLNTNCEPLYIHRDGLSIPFDAKTELADGDELFENKLIRRWTQGYYI